MVVKALMEERMGTLICAPSGLNGKLCEDPEEEPCAGLLEVDVGDPGMGVGRWDRSGIR